MNSPIRTHTSLISRRRFSASAAVLAAAGPLILTSRSLGRTGANDRIRIGCIGMGIQARDHLGRFLKNNAVQVTAVCDVDTTRREHARKMVDASYGQSTPGFKGCAAYLDHRELLASTDVDAVLIATPDHWHCAQVLDAAAAKKDIYCEKPLSLTLREAKRMLDAARRHNIVFQTGSQQRTEFDGLFRTAVEHIRNGRIGRVLTVTVGVPARGPGITTSVRCDLPGEAMEEGLDWDRWLGPAPLRAYNAVLSPRGVHGHYPDWRLYREYSGGMLTDFGAHHFDIAQWGLGMDESGPVEVLPPQDEKSVFGARLRYASGIEVVHGGPIGIQFIGTEGTLYVDRGALRGTPDDVLRQPAAGKRLEDEVKVPKPAGSGGHQSDWIACIRSRTRPVCDVEVGARTAACCHLVNLAYGHRKALKWDPLKWTFVGEGAADANRWADVDRREGYALPDL